MRAISRLPPALSLLFLLALTGTPMAVSGAELRVAVAANFRAAATALAEAFEASRGVRIVVSSAATGVLASQWRSGAPFDVLLAADRERPEGLARDGLALGEARCYALGSLVLLGATNLREALADPRLSVAIGNPVSAPYGAAALAVLERPGFAGPGDRRVLRGGNVMQAHQFYASGAADLALVARSLSPNAGLPVPTDWHPPIEQYAIVNPHSNHPRMATALLEFFGQAQALVTLRAFGYRACP